jgi:hypothetical protein
VSSDPAASRALKEFAIGKSAPLYWVIVPAVGREQISKATLNSNRMTIAVAAD